MMSKMPQEAFYAEMAWVRMPEGSYDEILKEARTKGVHYLVIDENIERDSPGFLDHAKNRELKPLFEMKKSNRYMIVFEMMDPKGEEAEMSRKYISPRHPSVMDAIGWEWSPLRNLEQRIVRGREKEGWEGFKRVILIG
jgi:hypothetical protein